MATHAPLPGPLGDDFSVRTAMALGVTRRRLRGADLERPFRGARTVSAPVTPPDDSPYGRQRQARLRGARAFAPLLRPDQFLSHESASALWGAPLPLVRPEGRAAILPVHVSTFGHGHLPRVEGVVAHRAMRRTSSTTFLEGILLKYA